MAESLAVGNPAAEHNTLTAQDQSNLLREIVDHISHREQKKFSEHLQPKLQATLHTDVDVDVVAATMYRPEEQYARLMAYVAEGEISTSLPASLPDGVRPAYEEAVRTFLPDHPFVKARQFASIVFSDFVMAAGCNSIEIRASLAGAPERQVKSVGPFFARFLADNPGPGSLKINETLVEHVVESWNQEADLVRAHESEVSVTLFEGEGSLHCIRDVDPRNHETSEIEFDIADVSGAFHIHRPIKRASVLTDQGVILGDTRQHLMVGPDVVILAEELIIEAETLRIDSDHGQSKSVVLASDRITANYLTKVEAGPENLDIFSADPPARLRPYMRAMTLNQHAIPFQSYLDLRTILTSFRPSTKGSLSVLAAKIDNKIVKDNGQRLKILDHLIEIGAVSRNGTWYYLDLNVLGKLGFGIQDLKTGEPSAALLRFLHHCIAQ